MLGLGGAGNTFKDEFWVKFAMTHTVELKIIGFGGSCVLEHQRQEEKGRILVDVLVGGAGWI